MAIKPLDQLLKEADRFLVPDEGISKSASAAAYANDGVVDLAEKLLSAGALESVAADKQEEFEKVAEALNRAEARVEIDMLKKIAAFETKAQSQGYSQEQVNEAVNKIASQHLKKSLPILVGLEASGVSKGEGKNSLEKKKVPAESIGQTSRQVDLTRSLRYAR
jgi:hypothetical protein